MESYIAYVEDDKEDVEIFQELFCSPSPVAVKYFTDGAQLEQHLSRAAQLPCLILLDISNPVQSGTETVRLLQQHPAYQSIPVILFSSSVKSIRLDQFQHTDVSILEKPSSLKEWEQACVLINEGCKRGQQQKFSA